MREVFSEIYKTDAWGGGSGEGSFRQYTGKYIAFLQRFLEKHQIETVVDLGCGDWQFSCDVDWTGRSYLGLDIVPDVIDANNARHAASNVRFELIEDETSLPPADLLIAKDVLQHWSNRRVAAFLPQLQQYKYALLTNCVEPASGTADNRDIEDGQMRRIDLRRAPFYLDARQVFSFARTERHLRLFSKVYWLKSVLLVDNSGSR